MVVLVPLAINVGQKLDQVISPYRFSGGLARPQLHLAAFETDNRRDEVKVMVGLFSESYVKLDICLHRYQTSVARTETETSSVRFFNRHIFHCRCWQGSPGIYPNRR